MNAAHSFLFAVAHNFGAIVAVLFALYLTVAYTRGELQSFFGFLKEMLTDPETGKASSKKVGYFAGTLTMCVGFAKITLAVCRWIEKGNDPTMIYTLVLGAVVGLTGGVLIGAQALQNNLKAKLNAPPDTSTTQNISAVTNLSQDGIK